MIVSPAAIGSEWFLNGLAAIEREEARTQRQLSSGYRIQDASDSPAETSELIRLGSTLASLQAVQTNLGRVQAETGTADQAIGNSISLIESARTLAVQGASSTTTDATRRNLPV